MFSIFNMSMIGSGGGGYGRSFDRCITFVGLDRAVVRVHYCWSVDAVVVVVGCRRDSQTTALHLYGMTLRHVFIAYSRSSNGAERVYGAHR